MENLVGKKVSLKLVGLNGNVYNLIGHFRGKRNGKAGQRKRLAR